MIVGILCGPIFAFFVQFEACVCGPPSSSSKFLHLVFRRNVCMVDVVEGKKIRTH